MVDRIITDCDKIDNHVLTYIVGDLPFYTHSQWGSTLNLINTVAIVPQPKENHAQRKETSKKLVIPTTNSKEFDEGDLKAIHVISSQEFPLEVSNQIVSHLRSTIGLNKVVIQHLDPADSQLSPSLYNALDITPIIPQSNKRRPKEVDAFPSKNEYLEITASIISQMAENEPLDILGSRKKPKLQVLKYYDSLRLHLYKHYFHRLHEYPPSLDYDPNLTPSGKSIERIYFRNLSLSNNDAEYQKIASKGDNPDHYIKCLHCGSLERLRSGFRRHLSTRCKQHRIYLAIAIRYFENPPPSK